MLWVEVIKSDANFWESNAVFGKFVNLFQE